jgi:hypothetical protein
MGSLDERRAQIRNDSENRMVVTRAGVRRARSPMRMCLRRDQQTHSAAEAFPSCDTGSR